MKRVPEPELMDDVEQAAAYAGADFSEPHQRVVSLFEEAFSGVELTGPVLDLGCGPGDVTFRFARRFAQARFLGVDGSAAMLHEAERRRACEPPEVAARVEFFLGRLPGAPIPHRRWALILSTSFLHHLHDPAVLWRTVREHAVPGTPVCVVDLMRPSSPAEAHRLVETYSGGEPEILKRDFFRSLCAAFRPAEVRAQLRAVGLRGLTVRPVSDRHLMIHGRLSLATPDSRSGK
ncbi:MAG: class I SAM-dependent methyltransferase [Candidatus Sumerlaeia bacterium]